MSDERSAQVQGAQQPPCTPADPQDLRHRAVLAAALGQLQEMRRQMNALEAVLLLDLRRE